MRRILLILLLLAFCFACGSDSTTAHSSSPVVETDKLRIDKVASAEVGKILDSAMAQTTVTKYYSQKYYAIAYPNGDVPEETGACTDVIVRAFRKAGIDLQREVHLDMKDNFRLYPQKWGLPGPDTNIDHRRVPNLQTFFTRRGKSLPVSEDPSDYRPGDIVTWDLDGKGMTHIGFVSNRFSEETGRYLIIHNIGGGTSLEDRLFEWKITGRFRYF